LVVENPNRKVLLQARLASGGRAPVCELITNSGTLFTSLPYLSLPLLRSPSHSHSHSHVNYYHLPPAPSPHSHFPREMITTYPSPSLSFSLSHPTGNGHHLPPAVQGLHPPRPAEHGPRVLHEGRRDFRRRNFFGPRIRAHSRCVK
jgi:hypothetical protein